MPCLPTNAISAVIVNFHKSVVLILFHSVEMKWHSGFFLKDSGVYSHVSYSAQTMSTHPIVQKHSSLSPLFLITCIYAFCMCVCVGGCASDKHAHEVQRRSCSSWVLPYNHVGPGVFRIMGPLISPPEQLWGAGSATLAHFRQNSVSQLCKKTHKQREVNGSFLTFWWFFYPSEGFHLIFQSKG